MNGGSHVRRRLVKPAVRMVVHACMRTPGGSAGFGSKTFEAVAGNASLEDGTCARRERPARSRSIRPPFELPARRPRTDTSFPRFQTYAVGRSTSSAPGIVASIRRRSWMRRRGCAATCARAFHSSEIEGPRDPRTRTGPRHVPVPYRRICYVSSTNRDISTSEARQKDILAGGTKRRRRVRRQIGPLHSSPWKNPRLGLVDRRGTVGSFDPLVDRKDRPVFPVFFRSFFRLPSEERILQDGLRDPLHDPSQESRSNTKTIEIFRIRSMSCPQRYRIEVWWCWRVGGPSTTEPHHDGRDEAPRRAIVRVSGDPLGARRASTWRCVVEAVRCVRERPATGEMEDLLTCSTRERTIVAHEQDEANSP